LRLNKPGEAVMICTDNSPGSLGESCLRLFKSARDNPQPDVELVSIDFRSAMTQCAPFLIALSVE